MREGTETSVDLDEVPEIRVVEARVDRGPADILLLVFVGALVTIGLFEVYIASALTVSRDNPMGIFSKQVIGVLVGVFGMLVVSRIDYRRLSWWVPISLLAVALVLVGLTLIDGIGIERNGATRWLSIAGQTVQPSELLKSANLLFVAGWIVRKDARIEKFIDGLLGLGLVVGVQIFLLMQQPDFGTSLLVCSSTLLLLLVGGAGIREFGMIVVSVGLLGGLAITLQPYRFNRFAGWLDPFDTTIKENDQLRASLVALARGGLEGTGLANARAHLGYVPEVHNDFIAAAVAEQFGLLGFAVLVALYLGFFWRSLVIAKGARDRFGFLLAIGIGGLICGQGLFNLGVVNGTFPTKGLTLPFVSAGLSSLLLLFLLLGVLLNIGQSNPNVVERSMEELRAAQQRQEQMSRRIRRIRQRILDTRRRHGAR
jgi:cell division protein FtsW